MSTRNNFAQFINKIDIDKDERVCKKQDEFLRFQSEHFKSHNDLWLGTHVSIIHCVIL